ncbi:MAG TPA: ATP-binding protein [Mycobacteriales bacterium]|nr:ATP-binding protein [Mycobacteriales bacterium]
MTAPQLEEAVCALPLGVRAVGVARRFIEQTLPTWGADREQLDTATLIASELVTNAVLYGYGAATLELRATGDRVRILVSDGAAAPPQARAAAADAEIGRGLRVVEACCLAWGVEPAQDGKVVWCELGLTAG